MALPARSEVHASHVIEQGWERSPTLQRQCRELAAARAVVILEWGKTDSQSRAITRIAVDHAAIVVAHVAVPPVPDAVELVAHELEHIIERTEGLDPAAESKRRGSGVWRAFGGFETQRAIEAGRQASSEVREAERAARIRKGAPVPDATAAYKRTDDRTFEVTSKAGGKPTMTTRVAISADGKTMTATQTGQNMQGQKIKNVIVAHKQ